METNMTNTDIIGGDHRDLLDIIDNLRSQGVSHYVDLPQIIVCGDQSSGKSSVLEAISGMPFPVKDGLCTRFATELILRRTRDVTFRVSITPGGSRFGDDRDRLESWQPKANFERDGLGAVTEEAKLAMADPVSPGEFYRDILRIELTGPEQPHLTMVDLPGLFRTGNKQQSDGDVEIVRSMVERYMEQPRSIILTVVSAKYEYVLQEVTRMAKRADPEGLRTMGLITKPDTLDVGSDSESYFVRLAQNLEEELRLGWHVLKNRKFEERNVTSAERDSIEADFFRQGLWDSINPSHCGVAALRIRLSDVLREQILAQLPSLVQDVEYGMRDCADRLARLGPVRGTPREQLSYLMRVSEDYTTLVTQAVEGTYTNRFFGNRNKINKFQTRLRAVVQSRLRDFAEDMRLRGQSQNIVDLEGEGEGGSEVRLGPRISRSEYVEGVAARLKISKGRELPGLFNPVVVHDLFVEQCEPWRAIVGLLTEDVVEATHITTQMIVEHIAASDVADGVHKLIRQEIEGLKVRLDDQVDALLESASQHSITYNPQLIENVQRIQLGRQKRNIKTLACKMFGSARFDNPNNKISMNPIELLNLMGEGLEPDMERFGSALAVDYMEAYYKVALDRFIDDVSNLAIEDCLISKLSTLFRSNSVLEMSEEDISRLAGESQETSNERKRLEAKRKVLGTGLQALKGLHKRGNVVNSAKPDQLSSEDPETTSPVTPSTLPGRPEKVSIAASSPEPPRGTLFADNPTPPENDVIPSMPPDEGLRQPTFDDEVDDFLSSRLSKKKKKKASKVAQVENFVFDGEYVGFNP